jgi:hypothetical protein
MTGSHREEPGDVYDIGPWKNGRTTVTATGPTYTAVLAAGLAGVLVAYRGDLGIPRSADEATTALPLRAEGVGVAALFAALVTALVDEVDHAEYDVRAVQFDGLVRTDEGLTGWGYALAVPGGNARTPVTLDETLVTDEGGVLTLRATLRREG